MIEKKPLLELKNIGKIYVSEGNVAVGIRGVNLSFERGEFVAITGASGSGKSTLLNVISGMDSYEEGELLIEGEPTSHFLQKDWEEYRRAYISFIFQDYNILESFTVLQNVELALMSIEDPHERREKAMELLRRVGLEKHIHHKGSKLSGGQKQRTVIARALAKDSPIILADEPTGNLDSQSSKEIIDLLHEVSRDKLVIVVTHDFEEVEACATRHVRVFDGAIELDRTIRVPEPVSSPSPSVPVPAAPPPADAQKRKKMLRDGLHLGRVSFGARPKLAVFLCCLMTITSLVMTLMTASSYDATAIFDDALMFTHVDGRAVLARRDGAVMTDEELEELAADMGAESVMHYDFMLDRTFYLFLGDDWNGKSYDFSFGYPAADLVLDAGRYPERNDEVILDVPISAKPYLGGSRFAETELPLLFDMATYRVVGVRYYYDNTVTPRILFTEEGYQIASAMAFFSEQAYNFSYEISVTDSAGREPYETTTSANTYVDFDMEAGSYYLNLPWLYSMTDEEGRPLPADHLTVSTAIVGNFRNHTSSYNPNGFGGYYEDVMVEEIMPGAKGVRYPLAGFAAAATPSETLKESLVGRYYEDWDASTGIKNAEFVVLSPDIFLDFMHEHYYAKSYTQASLFFENDRAARGAVENLRELGYVAVVSDETVEPDVFTELMTKLGYFFEALGWAISVVFATFFLSLCTSRTMNAVRGDIGIMRSMGIPTGVVRVSLYIRTLIALIPACLITAAACVAIYLIPVTNGMFVFLHVWDYVILAVVLVAIAMNISRKQADKMFNESVKKTLRKGGDKA